MAINAINQKQEPNFKFETTSVNKDSKLTKEKELESKDVKNDFVKTPTQDEFVPTKIENEPPDIGRFRLITGFLTDKQVQEINKSGKLPPNAKFIMNGYGGYTLSNNFFGLRVGTQTIPQGFEVKKNIIGQAVILPKDANGLLIK